MTDVRLRRIKHCAFGLLLTTLVGLGIWYQVWMNKARGPSRDQFVREMSAVLANVSSPEDAEARIENCGTLRFPDGEWLTGVGVDGHSWKRAKDTMVVLDSRGQVKAYVGHYCGSNWMPRYFPLNHPDFSTLDKVYAFFEDWGFREYSPAGQ
jgi:hypothetical protein